MTIITDDSFYEAGGFGEIDRRPMSFLQINPENGPLQSRLATAADEALAACQGNRPEAETLCVLWEKMVLAATAINSDVALVHVTTLFAWGKMEIARENLLQKLHQPDDAFEPSEGTRVARGTLSQSHCRL